MTTRYGINVEARAEDVRWMAETGESATGAARRLGMTRDALEKWCRNHAADDWRRLVAREPADPSRAERARAGAMARWTA